MKKSDKSSHQTSSTEPEDAALRPETFDEYTGQSHIMPTLRVMVEAARKRGDALGHLIFSGPAGLGKTTIARIVANEIGSKFHMVAAPSISSKGELFNIFNRLERQDVLFIDEIHRLNITAEENIYPAVEDYYFDVVVGSGANKRNLQYELPRFTLLGATTRQGLISSPMRTRMAKIFRMKYYEFDELADIAQTSANKLGLTLARDAADGIARRARGTPRTVNQHLRLVRDFAYVQGREHCDKAFVDSVMESCNVDEYGLGTLDRLYLEALVNKFGGGPVGLSTMSSVVDEEPDTLEEVVEQYLLQQGFIKKTTRGRQAMPIAIEHVKGG